ncbi:MAG: tetratricopeptide repeat protein [Bacteroidales bacterium]|nr:tetratricopeptide repeat protein [Bacteroidales bacterium]
MKKIILIAAAALLAAFSASAQDMKEATEIAKAANEAWMGGDFDTALSSFKEALSIAEQCGDEGLELAVACQSAIPQIMLSQGKNLINEKKYDEAVAKLNEVAEVAESYGETSIADKAKKLVPDAINRKAGTLLKAQDFAGAVEALNQLIAINPANGQAYVNLGAAQEKLGNMDEAIAAYESAAANGKEAEANKKLSTVFLKKASAALKGGNAAEALENAVKSNDYVASANACKVAASASMKLGKPMDAINFYEKYLEVNPSAGDKSDIIFTIAATYQKAGNKAKAAEYYGKLTGDVKYGQQAQQQLQALK